jgi:mono/diheme cytochrome c family protein
MESTLKITITIIVLLFSLHSHANASTTGKELFKERCGSCHINQGGNRLAPPLFAVKGFLKRSYPDQISFTERLVDWVKSPNPESALMSGAVKKYGLMPGQPYPEEEIRVIAEFMYE